jgi:thiol-disulfide isomerase/thioredoxin
MAKTRKNKFQRRRRTVRGQRSSVMGKVMPLLDVRTPKQLKEFEKRIKKGPLTIIMVYADWCGHCHTMMPHFKEASKSPNRQIQSIMLNEEMMDSANSYINKNINHSAKPINVSGYPSLILVDNKSNKVTDIEPVRDTQVMTDVMNKSASLAKNSGLINNSAKPNNMKMNKVLNENKNKNTGEQELLGTLDVISNDDMLNIDNMTEMTNNANKNNVKNSSNEFNSVKNEIELSESLMNSPIESVQRVNNSNLTTVVPPVVENDITAIPMKGGNLMAALSRTSYTLAPAAVLLASASYVMKGKKTKGRPKKVIKKIVKSKKTKKMRK